MVYGDLDEDKGSVELKWFQLEEERIDILRWNVNSYAKSKNKIWGNFEERGGKTKSLW